MPDKNALCIHEGCEEFAAKDSLYCANHDLPEPPCMYSGCKLPSMPGSPWCQAHHNAVKRPKYEEQFRQGNTLLEERGKTHGNFTDQFTTAQHLKLLTRSAFMCNHRVPHAYIQEALEMICTKISRICHGNALHKDHWDDIAGYAQLVAEKIEQDQGK